MHLRIAEDEITIILDYTEDFHQICQLFVIFVV
mgnify:CR=1 FL=1